MTTEFEVANAEEYVRGMERLSREHPGCWVGAVVFGLAYAVSHATPSRIPHDAVGDSPPSYRAYWRGGQRHPFSDRLTTAYVNSCQVSD